MEPGEIKTVRLEKLKAFRDKGISGYGGKFARSESVKDALASFSDGKKVILAGRIMAHRKHGKVIFIDLADQTAKIQLYVKADIIGEAKFELMHNLDIGDIIGVEGELFKTHTGQDSVRAKDFSILSKSLMTLPEKWHGLKDVEVRYRQRYVDLIANPEVKDVFVKRSKIITAIRAFLDKKGFLEVETPMLQPMAGGARGRPFKSTHNAYDMEVFLRIAPELYLKRLLVGGLEKVYEINRNFRNEGVSTRHNPEFTMLEVYEAYSDCEGMMTLTEEMISGIVQDMHGSLKINYQGREIDFTTPWERRSFAKIVKDKFGISSGDDAKTMLERVKAKKKIAASEKLTRSGVMKIVEELLEEEATANPVFLVDYFAFLSPLAKTKPKDPTLAERFELFIGGLEVGNAYSELNDAEEQKKRLTEDLTDDTETGNRVIDEDFIHALEYGMPPAGGLGVGVDRLVMLLTDAPSIRDVILFPLLKPEQK